MAPAQQVRRPAPRGEPR